MTFKKWLKDNPIKWDKSNYDAEDVLRFMQLAWDAAKNRPKAKAIFDHKKGWYGVDIETGKRVAPGYWVLKESILRMLDDLGYKVIH